MSDREPCPTVDELLLGSEGLWEDLPLAKRQAVADHLAGCAHCRAELQECEAIVEEYGRLLTELDRPDVRAARRARFYAALRSAGRRSIEVHRGTARSLASPCFDPSHLVCPCAIVEKVWRFREIDYGGTNGTALRGVGRGVAIGLAEAGFKVFGTGRSVDEADLPDTVTRIRCDHLGDAETATAFARVVDEAGTLDVLVNSAWGGYERMVENGGSHG